MQDSFKILYGALCGKINNWKHNYCHKELDLRYYKGSGSNFSRTNIAIKNSEEVYERIIEMSKKIGYAIGNVLDYEHFSNYYKLISSKQAKRVRKPKHNTTN